MLGAAGVELSYTCSVIASSYFCMSLFQSLYFCTIDLILYTLLLYGQLITGFKANRKWSKILMIVIKLYMLVDIILMMINPFKEISISYSYDEDSIMPWRYVHKFPYEMHLVFSYILVATFLFILVRKILKTPSVFRKRYIIILLGISFVVVLNAMYLFIPNETSIDFSIIFYSIIGLFMYFATYHYSETEMLNAARKVIINEFGYPVVLFDYEGKFAMCNNDAKFLLPDNDIGDEYTISEFVKYNNMEKKISDFNNDSYFKLLVNVDNMDKNFRCDYKVLRDKKDKEIAKLFVLTDNSLHTDIVTGFYTENKFKHDFANIGENVIFPAAVAIFDINKLSFINHKYGRETGDKSIAYLADIIRENCNKGTYKVRLHDANLMVICFGTPLDYLEKLADKIKNCAKNFYEIEETLEVQYAVNGVSEKTRDFIVAVENAENGMRSRKLMDRSSAHSSLLDSFQQMLQETDTCTEMHVFRTNEMGEKLGRKLGLSDVELSHLSLLCLLHDIGKLGIPIEILNKPGKLTNEKWKVMRSHAEKGYRIAKGSKELEVIADLILHHHESWDGSRYPDGQKKDEIPFLSRIIAVVDSYDAMTNDRQYRKALSAEEACMELKKMCR